MSPASLQRCSFPFKFARAGLSTAQAGLSKIITIIGTIPPVPSPKVSPPEVDVNLELSLGFALPVSEGSEVIAQASEEEERIPNSQSGVVDSNEVQTLCGKISMVDDSVSLGGIGLSYFAAADASSEGECSADATRIEQKTVKFTQVFSSTCKDGDGIVEEEAEGSVKNGMGNGGEGYLDLLLEAARQISGECGNCVGDEDDETSSPAPPSPTSATADLGKRKRIKSGEMLRTKRRRTSSAAATVINVVEKAEPIVRSNRGRTQVLPSRYRDSVLEPWRKPPTVLRR